MTTTYDVGNSGPCLVQAHKCGSVKPANGIQNALENWISSGNVVNKITLSNVGNLCMFRSHDYKYKYWLNFF
jgi:hypothetical protein